jgi:hypothetical protein
MRFLCTPHIDTRQVLVGAGRGEGVYRLAKKIGDEKANGGWNAPPNMGWLDG